MKVSSCNGCGNSLFVPRAVCPKCKGTEFGTKEVGSGVVAIATVVRSTRNGDSTPFNLVYSKNDGLRVLCRSTEPATEPLNRRENISLNESEGSVSCSRKEKRLGKSV